MPGCRREITHTGIEITQYRDKRAATAARKRKGWRRGWPAPPGLAPPILGGLAPPSWADLRGQRRRSRRGTHRRAQGVPPRAARPRPRISCWRRPWHIPGMRTSLACAHKGPGKRTWRAAMRAARSRQGAPASPVRNLRRQSCIPASGCDAVCRQRGQRRLRNVGSPCCAVPGVPTTLARKRNA